MKLNKEICKRYIFLDIPLLLLAANYVLYNALNFDILKDILRVVAILLFISGWILKGNFNLTKERFIAILLAIAALAFNGTLGLNFFVIIIFSICVSYDIKRIIKSSFNVNFTLTLILIILMLSHVIENKGYISSMGRLRYTLGFENPNVAALFYSSAIYLLLISREKLKYIFIITASIFSIILYYYTDSRTALVALLVFSLLEFISRFLEIYKMNLGKTIFTVFSTVFIDFLFAFNLLSIFFLDKLMVVDALLSFRISTFSRMVNSADIMTFLFGGTIKTVDNFYYMLLFQYGILVYLFIAVSVHFFMIKMIKNNNLKYMPLLVGMFLVATMESSLIRPEILISLVVWKLIFSSDYKFVEVICDKGEQVEKQK